MARTARQWILFSKLNMSAFSERGIGSSKTCAKVFQSREDAIAYAAKTLRDSGCLTTLFPSDDDWVGWSDSELIENVNDDAIDGWEIFDVYPLVDE